MIADQAETRRLFAKLMKTAGITTRCAATVKAGIAELAHLPGLVVLEMKLSDGSGLQVLAEIRRLGLRCKTAVVSAANDPAIFQRVVELQPDAIFGKPLDFEDFVAWMCDPNARTGADSNHSTDVVTGKIGKRARQSKHHH